MIGKKINQLPTELAPATTDLTIIGNPVTGVSKKITLSQIANLFATSGTVTSVAVTETGNALTITGSPITTAGTINIGFAGAATQYVRGDGQLSDFPTSTGGGSSVSYYLNSSVSQGTLGGVAYRQFSKTPIAGAGTDITVSANGYIASYITDANDPALLEVPAGNFNCELYFSVNSNNHNPYVYAEVYKYDGTTFTLLGSSQSVPEYLTSGTTLSPYYFAVPVTATVLTITDRIAIRIYANVDGRTVTLHTENSHLCQVVTTFSKGLTSLNNLTRQVQFLATGTSGTDFNIASSTATHTFNLPTASATNRGALSSADWTTFNNKQNALTNPITGTGASGQVAFFNGTTSVTGTNNFFWDTANNRLGIGLTNPQRSIEIFNSTADNHLRLSGNAPSVSMGEAVTGSVYQAKFGLVTTNGQFVSAGVAGDFVIISQTGATIIGTSSTEKMRVNTSGNVSINNTNNTYKLDVTGTGRYTGQLRLESTITDGTNTYTLPSATGTLALTSQLTGGTVTSVGLSSATSGVTIGSTPITTSGTITLAIATASGSAQGLLSSTDWTTFNNKQAALNGTGFVKISGTTISYDNSTYLTTSAASSTYLPLTGGTLTGALGGTSASFSSNVTTSTSFVSNITNGYGLILNRAAVGNYNGISLQTASSGQWFIGMRENLSSNNYIIYNENGTDALTIAKSNSAATFSSSLTAGGNISTSGIYVGRTTNGQAFGCGNGVDSDLGIFVQTNNIAFSNSGTSTGFSFAIGGATRFSIAGTGAATFTSSVTATTGLTVGSLGSGSDAIITLATNASGAPRTIYYKASTATINFTGTGGTDLMTLTNGGNLGIGTTSPNYKLVVNSGTEGISAGISGATYGIRFDNGGTFSSGMSTIHGVDTTLTGSYQPIMINGSDVRFGTGATERMRITSGGNLLVGTTTDKGSAGKLQVNGNIYSATGYFSTGITITISALNTNTVIKNSAYSGLIVIRDNTNGGSAVWLADPNMGYIQIANNMPGTFSMSYSAGVTYIQKNSGSVSVNYGVAFYSNEYYS
jgi:hypothetical protein